MLQDLREYLEENPDNAVAPDWSETVRNSVSAPDTDGLMWPLKKETHCLVIEQSVYSPPRVSCLRPSSTDCWLSTQRSRRKADAAITTTITIITLQILPPKTPTWTEWRRRLWSRTAPTWWTRRIWKPPIISLPVQTLTLKWRAATAFPKVTMTARIKRRYWTMSSLHRRTLTPHRAQRIDWILLSEHVWLSPLRNNKSCYSSSFIFMILCIKLWIVLFFVCFCCYFYSFILYRDIFPGKEQVCTHLFSFSSLQLCSIFVSSILLLSNRRQNGKKLSFLISGFVTLLPPNLFYPITFPAVTKRGPLLYRYLFLI